MFFSFLTASSIDYSYFFIFLDSDYYYRLDYFIIFFSIDFYFYISFFFFHEICLIFSFLSILGFSNFYFSCLIVFFHE